MANYITTDTELTSVADAIRAKGGTSAPLAFPDGFVSAVQAFPDAVTLDSLSVTENGTYTPSSGHAFSEVTVDVSGGGGDTDAEDGIITRTISGSYYNSRVTQVCSNIFMLCTSLTTVNFPACTTIDYNAFYSCTSLTTISFPVCTTIGSQAFYSCTSLTTISFPVCTTIGSLAFYSCSRLTTVNFPACTTIHYSAFYSCTSLTTISFPVCTTIGSSAFRNCRVLLSAYFLGSSVPTLINTGMFNSTPISTYTVYTSGVHGSIFVRASLLTAFQTAANWSYYSSRIVGLTDEEIAALDAQE